MRGERERERTGDVTHRGARTGRWSQGAATVHHNGLSRNSTTFFFTNFPQDHGAKEMWEIFNKWGKVIEVVIPSRVDKYGKKFGFVRFWNVNNSKQLAANLDQIWIGSYKIWANLPKFVRRRVSDPTFSGATNVNPRPRPTPRKTANVATTHSSLRDARNFADVVKFGRKNIPTDLTVQKQIHEVDLDYKTTDTNPQWLRNSYVGTVSSHVDPEGLKDKLFMDGFYSVHVTILGGRTVLLRKTEEGEMDSILEDEADWFNCRFDVLRKWEPSDVPKERFTWVRCYGVPLHAWEEVFLQKLASLLGQFLGIDHLTRSHQRLKYGRILIVIPLLATVDKLFRVMIDGNEYSIKIVEEQVSFWNQGDKSSSSSTSSSSNSGSSWMDRALEEKLSDWNAAGDDSVNSAGLDLGHADPTGLESGHMLSDSVDPQVWRCATCCPLSLHLHNPSLMGLSTLGPWKSQEGPYIGRLEITAQDFGKLEINSKLNSTTIINVTCADSPSLGINDFLGSQKINSQLNEQDLIVVKNPNCNFENNASIMEPTLPHLNSLNPPINVVNVEPVSRHPIDDDINSNSMERLNSQKAICNNFPSGSPINSLPLVHPLSHSLPNSSSLRVPLPSTPNTHKPPTSITISPNKNLTFTANPYPKNSYAQSSSQLKLTDPSPSSTSSSPKYSKNHPILDHPYSSPPSLSPKTHQGGDFDFWIDLCGPANLHPPTFPKMLPVTSSSTTVTPVPPLYLGNSSPISPTKAITHSHNSATKSDVRNTRLRDAEAVWQFGKVLGVVATLNVRGLGGAVKKKAVRSLVHKENLDFICIQETKLEHIDCNLCSNLWDGSDFDWVFQPSIGKSGGILSMWRKDKFVLQYSESGPGFLEVCGKFWNSTENCHLVNVYSPSDIQDKRRFWLDLERRQINSSDSLWCYAGDFNSIKSSDERQGSESHGRLMEISEFNGFINNLHLLDLPLAGRRFTWVKGGHTMSRLDRFLFTSDWASLWPSLWQKGMPRLVSDHCAVILSDCHQDWGPKPFRVLNAWFEHSTFTTFVEKSLAELQILGFCMYALKEKLKNLKSILKKWNKEHFGIIDAKIVESANGIHELDLKGESFGLSDDEVLKRSSLWADLWQARSMQHSLLCQKSRAKWLKEGDSNSKFFHGYINSRRRSNSIQGLRINGLWTDDVWGVRLDGHGTSLGGEFFLLGNLTYLTLSLVKLNRSKAPLKVTSFAWRLFMDRIPTKDALSRRGVLPTDANDTLCSFCHENPESSNHLFSSCSFSYLVWQLVYKWLDISVALHHNTHIHFLNHMGLIKDKKSCKFWSVVWLATVWAIWLSRNDLIFNNTSITPQHILESARVKSWLWIKGQRGMDSSTLC
ncbi:hypothetical protein Lal_00022422 [Lupinus albus]|nr:hypothetical protein Lal_00022422 [Lupinus albus]